MGGDMTQTGNATWLAALLLLLPTLTACGGRGAPATGSDRVLPRNEIPGLIGRSCDYVSDPGEIPPFSRLARIGTRGNIAVWGLLAQPADTVVLSIRYDEDGRLAWVRSIRSSATAEAVASLERLVLESMNERGPADWGVRMNVVGGALAGLEPSIVCPPAIRRTGGRTAISMPTSDRGLRALQRVRGRRFRIEVSIDERGRIMGVRLLQSSGEGEVDQFILDWAHARRYHPKLHDGIGYPTTFEQTIYLPRRR